MKNADKNIERKKTNKKRENRNENFKKEVSSYDDLIYNLILEQYALDGAAGPAVGKEMQRRKQRK